MDASEINTRLWVVPVVMGCRLELQALPSGPAVRDLAVFHDHEGFNTLRSSKSFAIMKVRSGVRIAAADRISRAGKARPAGAGAAGGPWACVLLAVAAGL
jgi:hypothetical protein